MVPISITATRVSSLIRNKLRGTPKWLLVLPMVFSTPPGQCCSRIAAHISFVLVLPQLPVIASTLTDGN